MRLLSDTVPLRRTSDWTAFYEVVPLPHRYGSVGGSCIPYSADRSVFVWADHPVLSIDKVTVGGQSVSNWVHQNGLDSSNKPVAFVKFDAPVDAGAEVIAYGRGKLSSRTGSLLVNPADILEDILTVVCGLTIGTQLSRFKQQCTVRSLEAAGSLSDEEETIYSVIRSVAESFDALVCVGSPELIVFRDDVEQKRKVQYQSLTLTTDASKLSTSLRVGFAQVDGSATQTLIAVSPEGLRVYGERVANVELPWVSSARVAFLVATSILKRVARASWKVALADVYGRLYPGEAITIDLPVAPTTVDFVCSGVEYDLTRNRSTVSGVFEVGGVPSASLVAVGAKIEDKPYSGASLTTQGDNRVLTIFDPDGKPAAGVSVLLNGQYERFTDGAGKVTFPVNLMPVGKHTLLITSGDVQFSIEVTV